MRCLLTVKLNIIFFPVRLEFSTLPGGIIVDTHAAVLSVHLFFSFRLRNIKTKVGKFFLLRHDVHCGVDKFVYSHEANS